MRLGRMVFVAEGLGAGGDIRVVGGEKQPQQVGAANDSAIQSGNAR